MSPSRPCLAALVVLATSGGGPGRARATENGTRSTAGESRKEPKTMNPPTEPDRNYDFTFRSQMDTMGPDLAGYLQVLRVQGATGHAVMVLNRYGGDLIRRPVGLFGATLTKMQTAAVGGAVDGIRWAELPQPKGGDINAAILSIDYSAGKKIVQRSFNARNTELLQALAPVMDQVTALSQELEQHPLRALDVSVAQAGTGFRVSVRNVGSGPVLLADPRHLATPTAGPRATVRVASAPPGMPFSRLLWESVPLEPLGAAPAVLTLEPGKAHEVGTVAWAAKAAGDHYVQAVWQDYVGPAVDPKTVMDAIPAPDKLGDPRPYVIRGAAFSGYTKFTADKPRR